MATYTHEEVLEDGTKKVSIYDADSHKLLNYYHLNSKGEKHGLEVMYDSDGNVRRRCEYENGKKHGREVMYDSYGTVCCRSEYEKGKKHGYEYDYRGFASTRLYENGECVMFTCPPSEIKDFLKENVLCGKYILNICKKVEVTKKNGQYQHISASDGNYTVYSMTFNNNKEFNGWANSGAIEPRYTYKKGVLDGYIETDSLGVYNIEDRQEGKYTDGQFTGKKCISSKHSLAKKIFIDLGFEFSDQDRIICYQKIEKDQVISEHCEIHPNNPSKYPYQRYYVDVPYNGMATITWEPEVGYREKYTCRMIDGKKNGTFANYKAKTTMVYFDDLLNGPFIEFYDKDLKQKKVKYTYKRGKIDGPYIEFFENQCKKIEGFYKDGQKDGVWKHYSEDGKLIHTEFWRDGKNQTERMKTLKKIALERIQREDALSKGKEKRVILPKMSKIKKAIVIRKAREQNG